MSSQVKLNIEETKEFLRHIVKNNRFLQEQGKPSVAVEIEGDSGLGKTSAVMQLAAEYNMHVEKLNLAQIEELGDLVGFPIRQFQLCTTETQSSNVTKTVQREVTRSVPVVTFVKKTRKVPIKMSRQVKNADNTITTREVITGYKDEEYSEEVTNYEDQIFIEDFPFEETVTAKAGECIWVDEHAVTEYVKRGYEFTGNKRMSYCPPEWIADKEGGGFLILDDWNRADLRFVQAVMELVDRQEYISWKLPKDWHIILTANPDNGEYLVQSIDVAQRTRFVGIQLKFDKDVWARWAEHQAIDGRCINFLLMHEELISTRVNPRSVTTFFNCISSIPNFADQLPLIQMIGEGSVGPEFTTMFTTFINNKLDKLVTPKDMLLHANEPHIIGEIRGCVGEGVNYRADIASVLVTRLINFSIKYAESNSIHQDQIDRLIRLSVDDLFTDDLKYVMVKKILNGDKQKFQKLMMDPAVMKMAMK